MSYIQTFPCKKGDTVYYSEAGQRDVMTCLGFTNQDSDDWRAVLKSQETMETYKMELCWFGQTLFLEPPKGVLRWHITTARAK